LASRAEVGGTTNRAGFASVMSDLEIEMGCAQLALGTDVGIHAGAFAHPNAH